MLLSAFFSALLTGLLWLFLVAALLLAALVFLVLPLYRTPYLPAWTDSALAPLHRLVTRTLPRLARSVQVLISGVRPALRSSLLRSPRALQRSSRGQPDLIRRARGR